MMVMGGGGSRERAGRPPGRFRKGGRWGPRLRRFEITSVNYNYVGRHGRRWQIFVSLESRHDID